MFSYARTLTVGLAVILGVSLWTLLVASDCSSDGCIGVFLLMAGGVIPLGIQLLILVPVDAYRTHKRGEPLAERVAAWVGLSLGAFLLPLPLLFLVGF